MTSNASTLIQNIVAASRELSPQAARSVSENAAKLEKLIKEKDLKLAVAEQERSSLADWIENTSAAAKSAVQRMIEAS